MTKTRLRRLKVVTAARRRNSLKIDCVRPGVDMLSWIRISSVSLLFSALLVLPLQAQNTEQLQVGPPLHRAEPPAPGASPEQLERRGDELREDKNFLDAVDYYQAALKGAPGSASVFNKIGICQLMMQRYKEAKKSFERAIKADRKHADAYNNLGVVYYSRRNYNGAIKHYQKAILLKDDAASYYSNMGAAYFGKKQFEKAIQNYSKAMQLDPDIFERTSRAGVLAQLSSPEDRARYDYVLAKLYARTGVPDRSLHYLKKAMEEGYKDIKNVYTDNEFSTLRKDPRFAELMAAKTTAIPD
jgi:tetratricopeptide (TPR) repeat protein